MSKSEEADREPNCVLVALDAEANAVWRMCSQRDEGSILMLRTKRVERVNVKGLAKRIAQIKNCAGHVRSLGALGTELFAHGINMDMTLFRALSNVLHHQASMDETTNENLVRTDMFVDIQSLTILTCLQMSANLPVTQAYFHREDPIIVPTFTTCL